jgi:exodeoxyribonuclease-3
VRIATFNVNGITARLPALLAWLDQTKPDVACLQELKAPQERFPRAALEAAGYGAIWHGQSAWNGVAILRRGAEPVERRRGLPGDPTDLHSRYIEAEIGDLVVGCLYLPNGNPAPGPKFDYKLGWLKRFEAHAGNCWTRSGRSSWPATTTSSPPTWTSMSRTAGATTPCSGPRSARPTSAAGPRLDRRLADQHPGETIYTFWDYLRRRFDRNAGLRIDHLLLSPDLAPRLRAADVDRFARAGERPSDHAPTWIELEDGQ